MHLLMLQMFFKVKSVNNLNNVGRLDAVGNFSQMVSCGQMVDDCVQIIWYDLFLLRLKYSVCFTLALGFMLL